LAFGSFPLCPLPLAPPSIFGPEALGALFTEHIDTVAPAPAREAPLSSMLPGFRVSLCPRGRSDLLAVPQSMSKMEFRAITLAFYAIFRGVLPSLLV
jgi:hypothetical protein